MTYKEDDPEKLIRDFDNQVQGVFLIKDRCNLKGLQSAISNITKTISDFNEIRDTSLVSESQEKEFDDISSEYDQILIKLEKCKCTGAFTYTSKK